MGRDNLPRGSRAADRPCRKNIPARIRTRAWIVEDRRPFVGRVRRLAVRHHDFAHHEHAIGSLAIRENAYRLEHAIRAVAFGLHRRAAVKTPKGQLLYRWKYVVFLDLCLSAKIGDRFITVQPYIFQFILRHCDLSSVNDAKFEETLDFGRQSSLGSGRQRPSEGSILYANIATRDNCRRPRLVVAARASAPRRNGPSSCWLMYRWLRRSRRLLQSR